MSSASRATVLACSPDELRRAARLLRQTGAELSSTVADLQVLGTSTPDWSGLAALEQQARVRALATLITLACSPTEEAAVGLERCADIADDAAHRVRAHSRAVEDALRELAGLHGLGPPPEPLLLEAWRARLAELERVIASGRAGIEEAQAQFETVQRRTAGQVQEIWAPVLRGWSTVEMLVHLGLKSMGAKKWGQGIWSVGTAVRSANRARRARDHARWRQARGVLDARLRSLTTTTAPDWVPRKARPAARLGARALGPVGLIATWWSAFQDTRTKGGYEGRRGEVTQSLAMLAVIGVPALAAAPLLPVAGVYGAVTVSAYNMWSLGNWVYDNRDRFEREIRIVRALSDPVAAGTEVGVLYARTAKAVPIVRARVSSSLRRLGSEIRRLPIPPLGEPIRLPDVPIGGGRRLPIWVAVPWVLPGSPPTFTAPGFRLPTLPTLPDVSELRSVTP
ncbi:hypothetical protein ACQBAT_10060 [Ornithinimicrobium sp. Y1847]|uniref:hypothetical protein n=1 Tax=Ornithinimicrobium sp. Y1847 TaxID=3405419 RepID=UPI003B68251F